MTQGSFFLNQIEKFLRSNIYLFIASRYLIGRFLPKIIYDHDFKVLKNLKKNILLEKKKVILDIGGNDGMSYHAIRKFIKGIKIISFEPIYHNFIKLKKIEKKDSLYKAYDLAISNKNSKSNLIIPFFKKYALTQLASLDIKGVKNRLKSSLFQKNLIKKISYKNTTIISRKLDFFNLKPAFIKIDIEGHEYECILGGLKTIKKFKPIIMVEYDAIICDKIFKILKKYNYKKYFFNKKNNKIQKHKNENIFNIFFIPKKIKYDFN